MSDLPYIESTPAPDAVRITTPDGKSWGCTPHMAGQFLLNAGFEAYRMSEDLFNSDAAKAIDRAMGYVPPKCCPHCGNAI